MTAMKRKRRWLCILFGHIWQTWSAAEQPFRYCVRGDAIRKGRAP